MIFCVASFYVMPELQFSYIYNARKTRLSALLVKIFDQFESQPPVQSFFNQILILYF